MSEAWDKARLERLIQTETEESLTLDYKSCGSLQKNDDKKKTEVSKDVSSFANSQGGLIIYGISEEGHKPKALDIGYDPADISKEWLEDIILGRIQPNIDGIRIYSVKISAGPDRYAFVVDIPQSTNAHQAFDKKYYKRHNFKATPMHDYEIRDVMNRERHPVLSIDASARLLRNDEHLILQELQLVVQNRGTIKASDVKLAVFVPWDYVAWDLRDSIGPAFKPGKKITHPHDFDGAPL